MTDEARELTLAEKLENYVERFLEYQSKSKKLASTQAQINEETAVNDERTSNNRQGLSELLEHMVERKEISESGAISIGQCVLIYSKARVSGNTFKVIYTIHTPVSIDNI